MTQQDVLIRDRYDSTAVITLNRPDKMNALSADLRIALSNAIADLDKDQSIRAIIITGAGERAFCAGLDLKELGSTQGALISATDRESVADPVDAFANCSKPLIAAINGVAITGGFELALACDILIASTNARFADTHARVGVMPAWGLSQKLPRIIGTSRAKQISFAGTFIDALTAFDWGLVNSVHAPEELMPAAHHIASSIGEVDPAFVQKLKSNMDRGINMDLGDALQLELDEARAWNSQLDTSALEQRRGAVIARGRTKA